MIEAYSHVPYPFGTVVANDVFKSGIMLSDTDFRQFEKYLDVTGLDVSASILSVFLSLYSLNGFLTDRNSRKQLLISYEEGLGGECSAWCRTGIFFPNAVLSALLTNHHHRTLAKTHLRSCFTSLLHRPRYTPLLSPP